MHAINCAGRDDLAPEEAAAVGAAARAAGVILFPTDTLYGLGVDPGSAAGLAALFRLKGRDPGKPLPVLLAGAELVDRFAAAIPAPWRVLMERFWPGPLTLLFPALPGLPPGICSASGMVALRVPGSALCRSVLRAAGGSLTGTSANTAGVAGTGDPAVALRGLGSLVDLFVNAGTLPPSPASTLLDMDATGMMLILRAGVISEADLRTEPGSNVND
ncbi:MAG: L-threonylcarbamoyladenylate synthase [Candidatus Methylomirabilia bacterium]